MSFKTMTEANQEFVAKLYGLKAGLSLLALQTERMEIVQSQDKFVRDCLEKKRYELECARNQLASNYNAKDSLEKQVQEDRSKFLGMYIPGLILTLGGFLVLPIALGVMMMTIVSLSSTIDVPTIVISVLGFFATMGAVLIVGGTLMTQAKRRSRGKYLKGQLKGAVARWQESRDLVARLTPEATREEEAFKTHEAEHEAHVAEISERMEAIYKALYEEYDDVLDHRDWGSVDYLIYVFETMRADTLPGALDKLDTEKRAGRLEDAIRQASEYIAGSIQDSMSAMGALLSDRLNDLGARVEASNRKVVTAIGEASAEASRQAAVMNTGIAAQNALLAKANVSSASIAKNMNYFADQHKLYGRI